MVGIGTVAMLAAVVFGGAALLCSAVGVRHYGGGPIVASGLMVAAMADAMSPDFGLPGPLWAVGLAVGAIALAARARHTPRFPSTVGSAPAVHLLLGSFLLLGHTAHPAVVRAAHHDLAGAWVIGVLGLGGLAVLVVSGARRYLSSRGRLSIGAVGEACMIAQMLAMGAVLLV